MSLTLAIVLSKIKTKPVKGALKQQKSENVCSGSGNRDPLLLIKLLVRRIIAIIPLCSKKSVGKKLKRIVIIYTGATEAVLTRSVRPGLPMCRYPTPNWGKVIVHPVLPISQTRLSVWWGEVVTAVLAWQ